MLCTKETSLIGITFISLSLVSIKLILLISWLLKIIFFSFRENTIINLFDIILFNSKVCMLKFCLILFVSYMELGLCQNQSLFMSRNANYLNNMKVKFKRASHWILSGAHDYINTWKSIYSRWLLRNGL